MNWVNKVKDKWDERKFKKMEKDLIRIQQEMLAFRDQMEASQTGEMPIDVTERQLTPAINNELEKTMKKKTGYDEGGESPCHIEPDDICEERIKRRICNKNKKLLKKYRLREGNEREWIERIKVLMERQQKKIIRATINGTNAVSQGSQRHEKCFQGQKNGGTTKEK